MKITALIILFSLGTVFLFLKRGRSSCSIQKIETKKQVEVKMFKKSKFSKKLNLGDLAKLLELLSLKLK